MNKNFLTLATFMTLLGFVSCSAEKHFHEDKVFAGGLYVSAKTLNKGKALYTEYCMACHGVNGDGKGVAAKAMKVPPRDFTKGIFKFGEVVSGELVHDSHLAKLLNKGLNGTAMLPWDLNGEQQHQLIQYIKTFAPEVWEGKDKELGEQIVVTKDPYGAAHRQAAIEAGKKIYHGEAACWSCHRAYVPREELAQLADMDVADIEDEAYQVKLQETEWGFKNLPPEFTWDHVRSVNSVEDMYVRLNAGVGGTTMPSWKGVLEDDQIWAVSHYVMSLMELRNSPERKAFIEKAK
ncbi:MAG: c-type cytochrome [Bdellovibrionota bacterium]|nr:c-type cytochrome [Bdellovibrionota bacterium]